MAPRTHIEKSCPVALFQVSSAGLELLEGSWPQQAGMASVKWREIVQGGWRNLVPPEFHPEVQKLAQLAPSETYTVAEFPVYWQDRTIWVRVLAGAVEEPNGSRKVVGLAQDLTSKREQSSVRDLAGASSQDARDESEDAVRKLCHDISGPLTSILVSCERLMEANCAPETRLRAETILSEALRIDRFLRSYRHG
jgi:hypothetical protein